MPRAAAGDPTLWEGLARCLVKQGRPERSEWPATASGMRLACQIPYFPLATSRVAVARGARSLSVR